MTAANPRELSVMVAPTGERGAVMRNTSVLDGKRMCFGMRTADE